MISKYVMLYHVMSDQVMFHDMKLWKLKTFSNALFYVEYITVYELLNLNCVYDVSVNHVISGDD